MCLVLTSNMKTLEWLWRWIHNRRQLALELCLSKVSFSQLDEISFSKITVAADGSEQSLEAASYAISLADAYHSELVTLYVVSEVTQNDYDSDMQDDKLPESVRKIMWEARRESDPWFSRMRRESETKSSVKFHTKIVSPIKVSASIVNYAENTGVALWYWVHAEGLASNGCSWAA